MSVLSDPEGRSPHVGFLIGPSLGLLQLTVPLCVSSVIQKAGHHMEKTVIAAYIGVLVGHLAMDGLVSPLISY